MLPGERIAGTVLLRFVYLVSILVLAVGASALIASMIDGTDLSPVREGETRGPPTLSAASDSGGGAAAAAAGSNPLGTDRVSNCANVTGFGVVHLGFAAGTTNGTGGPGEGVGFCTEGESGGGSNASQPTDEANQEAAAEAAASNDSAAGESTPGTPPADTSGNTGSLGASAGSGSGGSASSNPGGGGGGSGSSASSSSEPAAGDADGSNVTGDAGNVTSEESSPDDRTATETTTGAESTNDTVAAAGAGGPSVSAELTCETEQPSLHNPRDETVDVTVEGPAGTETYSVGPGLNVGASGPSHLSPSLPAGDYAVTAVDAAGRQVPVNDEATYETAVEPCPTASLTTECADRDTVSVSFRAENLTGRHAQPVAFQLQSPTAGDRATTTHQPTDDGVLTRTFTVNDTERVDIEVRLEGDGGPDVLAQTVVEQGTCDETSGEEAAQRPEDDEGTREPADSNETDPPDTETPVANGTEEAARAAAEPVDVTLHCERSMPYIYNPNEFAVEVTVDGPAASETYEVGAGLDVGGPSMVSLQNDDQLPPGEYTVTAVDPDGAEVPVNGEPTYTTEVRTCPSGAFAIDCVNEDTARVTFEAERLDGRYEAPVRLAVQSPNDADRQTVTERPDADGSLTTAFEVSDTARASISAELDDPDWGGQLAAVRIDPGSCDDAASAPQDTETATPETTAADETTTVPANETGEPTEEEPPE